MPVLNCQKKGQRLIFSLSIVLARIRVLA